VDGFHFLTARYNPLAEPIVKDGDSKPGSQLLDSSDLTTNGRSERLETSDNKEKF